MTIFSFGAGQDSTTILYKILFEPSFRAKHVKGRLIVIGSDTGNEHEHTYLHVENIKSRCNSLGIEFHWVTPDMGFHPTTWQSLTFQYKRNKSIGSAAFKQTCTDNLKVKVVDNYTEYLLASIIGEERGRKRIFRHYIDNKIRLILGFADGEDKRTSNGNKFDPIWKKKSVERYYPLIIEGLSRQDCIDYNTKLYPNEKVWPSNCMFCFYQSDQEILWLYRFYPIKFYEWVEMEKGKLEKYAGAEKNYGVYGKITLEQKLEKAISLYGHWTDDQLNEYKYSHGHCIKSKY